MDWNLLLAYAGGLLVLYVLGRLFYVPAKLFGRLVGNAILGGIVLLVINWAGTMLTNAGAGFTLHLPLNPLTALMTGLLGVPGVLLVALLQIFLNG